MFANISPASAGLLGLLFASLVSSSPITPVTSVEQLFHKNTKRDCTGQSVWGNSNGIGPNALAKKPWKKMGVTDTDLAIIMKEDACRPTVESDENGSPGAFAFTIFNINWWMVKKSCPEYTENGKYTTSSNEIQIPPNIFKILQNDQKKAMDCMHKSMNDPYYNRKGDAPTTHYNPSPAWWAAQRSGPTAAISYLAGGPLCDEARDYMWNTFGLKQWIAEGKHQTDDYVASSCLTGLTAPAPCPRQP